MAGTVSGIRPAIWTLVIIVMTRGVTSYPFPVFGWIFPEQNHIDVFQFFEDKFMTFYNDLCSPGTLGIQVYTQDGYIERLITQTMTREQAEKTSYSLRYVCQVYCNMTAWQFWFYCEKLALTDSKCSTTKDCMSLRLAGQANATCTDGNSIEIILGGEELTQTTHDDSFVTIAPCESQCPVPAPCESVCLDPAPSTWTPENTTETTATIGDMSPSIYSCKIPYSLPTSGKRTVTPSVTLATTSSRLVKNSVDEDEVETDAIIISVVVSLVVVTVIIVTVAVLLWRRRKDKYLNEKLTSNNAENPEK